MRIDSHLHLWVNDPENYPWHPIGGYVPETVAPLSQYLDVMERNGVDGAVLVQPTPYGWDNAYLLHCKQENPETFRAVVLVDPLSKEAAQNLTSLFNQGADGLRINLHIKPLSAWDSQQFHDLMAQCVQLNCPVCFQLTSQYFPLLERLCEEYPLNFVIDHLGRPEPGCSIEDPQFMTFLNFSRHPNVFIKLSGMYYYSKHLAPFPDTWDLLRAAKDRFGADHCMWGSDFPFVEEHWSYTENIDSIQGLFDRSENDLAWIFRKTAQSLWWNG